VTQRTLADQLQDAMDRERRRSRVELAVMFTGALFFALMCLILCAFGVWLINDALRLGLDLDQVGELSSGLLIATSAVVAFARR
jgi:predicted nucleic acid-binding Zn ribbon protein